MSLAFITGLYGGVDQCLQAIRRGLMAMAGVVANSSVEAAMPHRQGNLVSRMRIGVLCR